MDNQDTKNNDDTILSNSVLSEEELKVEDFDTDS